MARRIHVPFDDTWRMQTDVRVSRAVRVGGFGATCGQCDLDARGRPLHAGQLWPQVEAVTHHLQAALAAIRAPARSVRRLEMFYVGPADEGELRAALRETIGGAPDVVLVPLPYFYYPGLRVELDAIFDDSERLVLRTADGDDMESALEALELPPESLLALRTYFTGSWDGVCRARREALGRAAPAVTDVSLPVLPAAVRVAATAARRRPPRGLVWVGGQLPVDENGRVLHAGDVEEQTRLVIARVEGALVRRGASLADVVKVNVHYVGGPTPEDLHRNLDVRSQLYAPPGPASTGVPVPRLPVAGAGLVVEAVAAR